MDTKHIFWLQAFVSCGHLLHRKSIRLRSHPKNRQVNSLQNTSCFVRTTASKITLFPYHHNPFFTGREEILATLHTAFFPTRTPISPSISLPINPSINPPIYALTGLAGIGKTQIAIEYLHRHHSQYNYIFWIDAQDREHLLGSFKCIARALPALKWQRENILRSVRSWMQKKKHWLLVLDNFDGDTPSMNLWELLPKTFSGHILLTSRQQLPDVPQSLYIQGLSPLDGKKLLLQRAGYMYSNGYDETMVWHHDEELALHLAQQVEGVPLVLDQLGSWVQEQNQLLYELLNSYQHNPVALLSYRGSHPFEHAEAILPTLWQAIAQLEKRQHTAMNLLKFCIFLQDACMTQTELIENALFLIPDAVTTQQKREAIQFSLFYLHTHHYVETDTLHSFVHVPHIVSVAVVSSISKEEQDIWRFLCTHIFA